MQILCKYYQNEVKFLGKIVDKDGVRLDPATTEAIVKMPAPDDKGKLRSFLGHMSYIGKHVPDLRKARAPLDNLLKPDVSWVWLDEHQKSFELCKRLAGNSAMLTHFDAEKPIVLTTDASPYGVGACLSHKVTQDNGKVVLQPVAYASASLKQSEKGYSQIDREGLAIYWAMQYFRQYLWCNEFELHTDCSALLKIFGPKNDLGGCATGRLNRWAAQLMEYSFKVKHIKGSSNATADSLSRLPMSGVDRKATYPGGALQRLQELPTANLLHISLEEGVMMNEVRGLAQQPQQEYVEVSIAQLVGEVTREAWDILPLTIADVAKATRQDKVYGKLYNAVRSGNLNKDDADIAKFNGVFEELYIEQEVLYFGTRVVIPTLQQAKLLDELHFTHIGAMKMKETARSYFWWPGITRDIDTLTARCVGCRKFRKKPPPAALCPWPFSKRPMERVHIDFCEYKGKMILIMIDSYSKKIWAHLMNTDTTALKTLAVLYGWFCEEVGFPTTLVSDNGPQFSADMFADKMKKWGIKHLFSPPYHPASNGLVERAVGIVKDRLKKMDCPSTPVQLHVGLKYVCRVHGLTPHRSTGRCPFEMIKEGTLPSLFPTLTPSSKKSELTAVQHSVAKSRNRRTFTGGDQVVVYCNRFKTSTAGEVLEVLGNNTYMVECGKGPQHVSGDCMSKVPEVATRRGTEHVAQQQSGDGVQHVLEDAAEDDARSIMSDSSIGSDIVGAPIYYGRQGGHVNNGPARRRRRVAEQLGPVQNLPRLRPRH